jgi:3-oxoacyl-[acyl-carrier protein] reductase
MRLDFDGQRVMVTGGTRGIGAGISRAFLEAGASVIATYTRNEEAAERFRAELAPQLDASVLDDRLSLERFDVSDGNAVQEFFRAFEGELHVLVNNAGIRQDAAVALMTDQDWRRVLSVNLDGSFFVTKQAVRLMSGKRYGRIVQVISPSGRLGTAGQANYAASKAGLEAMAKSLSKEVAKRGITVNCVSPGFVDTDLLADLDDETKKGFRQMVPMRRFGAVEEIAHAVLFLASRQASYVTGTTLEVSGGLS